jgi:hypothetical protein
MSSYGTGERVSPGGIFPPVNAGKGSQGDGLYPENSKEERITFIGSELNHSPRIAMVLYNGNGAAPPEKKAVPTIQYDKPIGPERPAPKVIPEPKPRKEKKPKAVIQYEKPAGPREPIISRSRASPARQRQYVQRAEKFVAAPKPRGKGLHGFRKRAEAAEAKFARSTRPIRAQVGPKRPRRRGGRKGAGWAKTHFKARALKGAAAGRRTSRGRPARGFGLRSWFSKRGRR